MAMPIALRAAVKGGWVDKRVLLDGPETRVALPAAPEWAIANAGGHGFYRVGYAPAMLKKLAALHRQGRAHRALQRGERRLRGEPRPAIWPRRTTWT